MADRQDCPIGIILRTLDNAEFSSRRAVNPLKPGLNRSSFILECSRHCKIDPGTEPGNEVSGHPQGDPSSWIGHPIRIYRQENPFLEKFSERLLRRSASEFTYKPSMSIKASRTFSWRLESHGSKSFHFDQ